MHGQDVRNELIVADDTVKHRLSGTKNAIAQGAWATYEAEKFHLLCSFIIRCWRRAKVGSRSTAMARLKMALCEKAHSDFPESEDIDISPWSDRNDGEEVPELEYIEPFPTSDGTSEEFSSADKTSPEVICSQQTIDDSDSKDRVSMQAIICYLSHFQRPTKAQVQSSIF